MNWWVKSWKITTKTELIVTWFVTTVFLFFKFFTSIPRSVFVPFYEAFIFALFIYLYFFKKEQVSLNHRLCGVFVAGILFNNFIRSISTFIAQWIVGR